MEACDIIRKGGTILLRIASIFNPHTGRGRGYDDGITVAIHDISFIDIKWYSMVEGNLRVQPCRGVHGLGIGYINSLSALCLLEFIQNVEQAKMMGQLCVRQAKNRT